MKYLVLAFVGLTAVAGCVDEEPAKTDTTDAAAPVVGMANPASVYCVEQGGKLEMMKSEAGEVGMCHLPDGTITEEWAYFKANHKG